MVNESDVSLSARIKQTSFDLNQVKTLGTKYLTNMAEFLLLGNYLDKQLNLGEDQDPNLARPVNFGVEDDPQTEEREDVGAEIDFITKMEGQLGKPIEISEDFAEEVRNEGLRLLRIKIGYLDAAASDLKSELENLRAIQEAANPT